MVCLLAGSLGSALAGCGSSETPAPTDGGGGSGGSSKEPILDGGGVIPPPPDGAALCPTGACNYQTGAGCSPDGGSASCVPLPMGSGVAPACERAGAVAPGGVCSQWTDCASGAICAAGRCRKLCCGRDWTGCGTSTEHCLRPLQVQLSDMSVVSSGAFLCYPVNQCDALVPTSCATIEKGTTCQIADPTGATACLPEGTGGAGAACPCKGGFSCIDNACRKLCRAVAGGGEPSCSSTETCVHYNRDPEGVGECTPD